MNWDGTGSDLRFRFAVVESIHRLPILLWHGHLLIPGLLLHGREGSLASAFGPDSCVSIIFELYRRVSYLTGLDTTHTVSCDCLGLVAVVATGGVFTTAVASSDGDLATIGPAGSRFVSPDIARFESRFGG